MNQNFFTPNISMYLSILLIMYLITYLAGKFVCGFISGINNNNSPLANIFNYLTIGFITIVTFFAIIWTKGDTVFIFTVLVIPFLISKNSSSKISFRFSKKEIIDFSIILLLFALSFSAFYYLLFIHSGGSLHGDFNYYANISNNLINSHTESTSWFTNNPTPNLYHYSELWFNALISLTFQTNHLHTLLLITYPFLFTHIIIGAVALNQSYFKNKIYAILIGILLLFFNPITTFFFSYQLPVATHPKFFVIAIFLLFAYIQYIKNNKHLAFAALMVMIPFNSVVTPGILSATFFVIIFIRISANGFSYKILFDKYLICCILFLIAISLFYFIRTINPSTNLLENHQPFYQNAFIVTIEHIARMVAYAITRLLPVMVIMYILKKSKKFRNEHMSSYWIIILWGIIGAAFSAIIGGIMTNFNIDGGQISINFTGIVITFIVYVCLVYLMSLFESKSLNLIIIGLLCLNVYYFDSDMILKAKTNTSEIHFYEKLKTEFKDKQNIHFGYIRNYTTIENKIGQNLRIKQVLPLNKIPHILKDGYYAPYCLSVFDIPDRINPRYDERRHSELWKYVEQSKKEQKFKSISEYSKEFIDKHKISYVIIEKHANIPDYLLSEKIIAEYDNNKLIKIKSFQQ